eukprot:TRINITY_DN674_c0_g1_i1.p2 TRINITY_DN674_c0_g1~~TRINITY_DN674_c0_g1_i1.p2  ORF type:complete len:284 (+),score=113.34 TRINITY_DN674_c0_g1_i1:113-853(+)
MANARHAAGGCEFVLPPPPVTSLAVAGSSARLPVRRIYCVGRNYWDHGIEMGGNPEREPPFFFAKPTDAAVDVSAAGATVRYPPATENLHHEVELVVVIGGSGSDVPESKAQSLVWGYGVGIDMTRRDLQNQAKQTRRPWDASKGFDQSAPCGAIIPAAAAGDLQGKTMTLRVNGEVRQQTALSKLIWNVPETVARLSQLFRLEPGDILFTGTPAGVAALRPGDQVVATVDGIPDCRFTVAPAAKL